MGILGEGQGRSGVDEGQYVGSEAEMVRSCEDEKHECPNMEV